LQAQLTRRTLAPIFAIRRLEMAECRRRVNHGTRAGGADAVHPRPGGRRLPTARPMPLPVCGSQAPAPQFRLRRATRRFLDEFLSISRG